MSILSQFVSEISTYARDFIKVEISPLNLAQGCGTVWNPGDTGTFSIKVTNSGEMDVKNFAIHVTSYFGKVKFHFPLTSQDWSTSLVPKNMYNIPAHSSTTIFLFYYKAENKTDGIQTVLKAHVHGYDLSWDHILVDHTWHTTESADNLDIVIYPSQS
jgi:hypothetical protein